jgi:hypothetical protein
MPAVMAFFVRALRVSCRSRGTYGLRLLIAFVILMSLVIFHISGSQVGAPGLDLFRIIVWINLIALFLLGIGLFATVITEEREEMTLGLLKMSALSSVSILLGKSTSRLLEVMLIILVQIPFVLLAVTLGGVSPYQIAACLCTSLAWAVLLSGFCLFISVCTQTSRNATGASGLLLFLFLMAPTVSSALDLLSSSSLVRAGKAVLGLVEAANPFVAASEILQTGFSGPLIGFQVISNLALGVLFFQLSWALFERLTREERGSAAAGRSMLRFASGRHQRWVDRPWSRAIAWKEFHFVAGGKLVALVKTVLYGLLIAIAAYLVPTERIFIGSVVLVLAPVIGTLHLAYLIQVSLQSEVNSRTFTSLMLLPHPVRSILYAKLQGNLIALLPELFFFTMCLVFAPEAGLELFPDGSGLLYMGVQILLLLHLVAFFSLTVKRGVLALTLLAWWLLQTLPMMLLSIVFMLISVAGFTGPGSYMAIMIGVPLLLTVLLHGLIVRRTREIAAGM